MAFTVVIMSRAQREIAAAIAWWRRNREAAPGLLDDELQRAVERLEEHPHAGMPLTGRSSTVRRLILSRVDRVLVYRIRPRAQRIEIVAFWYCGRGKGPLDAP